MTTDQKRTLSQREVPVLVVGAGPVGSVLALELAHHRVPSMVVERSSGPSRHPKMDYVNGRSMELLRRLGLAKEIRARGISAEHHADFLWTGGFDQPPVAIWRHPSVADMGKRYAACNDGSVPVEPYQRVQGSLLEEIVRGAARAHPLVDIWEGWTFTSLHQDRDGVTATLVRADGDQVSVHARFLVACDGANSTVRQCLGVPLDEAGPRTRHCSVYFTSRDPVLRKHGRAFVTVAPRGLTLVSRDEEDTWTASIPLPDDEPFTQDPIAMARERLGVDFTVDKVHSVAEWTGSLSLAAAYRMGSVFLAGDAAHQFFPTGGYGANTGIAEAVDLGWKLAACFNGWAGDRLLASYEAERHPVALFNREMCTNLLEVWRRFRRLLDAGTPPERVAGFLKEETYQVNNLGIHFDYRYDRSPVVWQEPGPAPPWHWDRIQPTTWPGSRAPAVRLADGSHLFDQLGTGFTLVDFSGQRAGGALVEAARQHAIPVHHLLIADRGARVCWQRDLVLVRPDQHVAWRGDHLPDDCEPLLDRVSGRVS